MDEHRRLTLRFSVLVGLSFFCVFWTIHDVLFNFEVGRIIGLYGATMLCVILAREDSRRLSDVEESGSSGRAVAAGDG